MENKDKLLLKASLARDSNTIDSLLKDGVDGTFNGHEAFYVSCMLGDLLSVKSFVNHGIDPNAEIGACMCIAVEKGHIEVVNYLISKGGVPYNYFIDVVCEQGKWEIALWLELKGLKTLYTYNDFEEYKNRKKND
jgi:hypothetical protein